MQPLELGKKFIQINRSLTWAETPDEWGSPIEEMGKFLDEIEDLLTNQKVNSEWGNKDFARILATLLTILAEAGQYRFEAFVPNPEKEDDIAKRKMIDEEMVPAMSSLRKRASDVTKVYFNQPVFNPIKKFIEDEIFPIVEGMDDSAPARYMPFRVIQAGNIAERLYRFKVRTQDKRLIVDGEHDGLLQSIYAFKYLRFGTSGVRGLWQHDFTEIRAKQVVQAICEYLKDEEVPGYLKGENLSGSTIIIGYDSRLNAKIVAEWAAQTCLNNGFPIEFANRDTPTPALVYWLTDKHSEDQVAGLINITASH